MPAHLSGRMAVHERGGVDWASVDLSFSLKEEDLAAVMGYKAAVDQAGAVPPMAIEAVAPTDARLKITLRNRGDYPADFPSPTTQPGDSGPVQPGGSVTWDVPINPALYLEAKVVGAASYFMVVDMHGRGGNFCIETRGSAARPVYGPCPD